MTDVNQPAITVRIEVATPQGTIGSGSFNITPKPISAITLDPVSGNDVIAYSESLIDLLISGTTQEVSEGELVDVSIGGVDVQASVDSQGDWSVLIPAVTVGTITDGDITCNCSVLDRFGATIQVSRPIFKAAQPVINIDPINGSGVIEDDDVNTDLDITGNTDWVLVGQQVTVTFDGVDYFGAVVDAGGTTGTWEVTIPAAALQALSYGDDQPVDAEVISGYGAAVADEATFQVLFNRESGAPALPIKGYVGVGDATSGAGLQLSNMQADDTDPTTWVVVPDTSTVLQNPTQPAGAASSPDVTAGNNWVGVVGAYPYIIAAWSDDAAWGGLFIWDTTTAAPYDVVATIPIPEIAETFPSGSNMLLKMRKTPDDQKVVVWHGNTTSGQKSFSTVDLSTLSLEADAAAYDVASTGTLFEEIDVTISRNSQFVAFSSLNADSVAPIIYDISGAVPVKLGAVAGLSGNTSVKPTGAAFHPAQDYLVVQQSQNGFDTWLSVYDYGADPTFGTIDRTIRPTGTDSSSSLFSTLSFSPSGDRLLVCTGDDFNADGFHRFYATSDADSLNWSLTKYYGRGIFTGGVGQAIQNTVDYNLYFWLTESAYLTRSASVVADADVNGGETTSTLLANLGIAPQEQSCFYDCILYIPTP